MKDLTAAERLALRGRLVTVASLAVLSFLAWLYLFSGAGMDPMAGMAGMAMAPSFALIVAMWWAMMIAMMVPSAAPTVLLYAKVHRHSRDSPPPTEAFLAGYIACWFGFSLLAAGLQIAATSPLSMALDSLGASAALLIAAGCYQMSPFKDACLGRCRSPARFLTRHYRPGALGAMRLGLLHGAYCVGCCWMLMALLFVGGVMNLGWIAALTLLVAAEKLLPGGRWIARLSGVAMVGWGVAMVVTPALSRGLPSF